MGKRPDIVLLLLLFVYFRNSVVWILESFTNSDSYEFGILFLVIFLILIGFIFVKRKNLPEYLSGNITTVPLIGFSSAFAIDILNSLFFHFNIVSGIAFFIGIYSYIGFYLRWDLWKRGLYIIGIFIFTLPLSYHIQTFLGFPLRVITAKLVSVLLGLFGADSFTETTVIVTENNASSVDLPCSGVKSLYTGAILMLFIYFLKKVRFSLRLIFVSFVYFFALIFFNFWRVYILVYIYDIAGAREVGDLVHVSLGIFGFLASGVILWFLSEKFLTKSVKKGKRQQKKLGKKVKYFLILFLVFLTVFDFVYFSYLKKNTDIDFPKNEVQVSLDEFDLRKIEFSEKEKGFFINRDVEFSGKYEGETETGVPFSLLIVASNSWRTHHNPEICIQGMGYEIESSEMFQIDGIKVRKVNVDSGTGSVIYWFTNREETLTDYSERIWHGIIDSTEEWILIEIGFGFGFDVDMNNEEVIRLISELNNSFK